MEVPPESWLDPRVAVLPSPIHKLGLFARDPLGEAEVVAVLGGEIVTNAEVGSMLEAGQRYDGIAMDADLNLRIEPSAWPGIHGNHSCDPNLWMSDALTVVARCDISAGTELLVDYSLYTTSPSWFMECKCGSHLCRGVVTGGDWRIRELQHRYRGHFAPVVERLIASARS